MSATEDQPAIGSPEWYRALPPSVSTRGDLKFSRTHVWTDDNGNVRGNIELGSVDVTFRTPAQVRDLIGRLAALAGEMDAEITRQQPAPALIECKSCHLVATGDDGALTAYLRTDGGGTDWYCADPAACGRRRKAARDAEAAQVTR